MTTHAKCPECGLEMRLCDDGIERDGHTIPPKTWHYACGEGHWFSPWKDSQEEASEACDKVVGAYWREQEAGKLAGEHRIGPDPVAIGELADRVARLEEIVDHHRQRGAGIDAPKTMIRHSHRLKAIELRLAALERAPSIPILPCGCLEECTCQKPQPEPDGCPGVLKPPAAEPPGSPTVREEEDE